MDSCGSSGRIGYDVRILVFRDFYGTDRKTGQRFFTISTTKMSTKLEEYARAAGETQDFS